MKKPEQNPVRWNVSNEACEPVASPSSESILEFALPAVKARESALAPSGIEKEVIELFDQLRSPLLRYVFSFGLATADGEEIIQEAFLALCFSICSRAAPARISADGCFAWPTTWR